MELLRSAGIDIVEEVSLAPRRRPSRARRAVAAEVRTAHRQSAPRATHFTTNQVRKF